MLKRYILQKLNNYACIRLEITDLFFKSYLHVTYTVEDVERRTEAFETTSRVRFIIVITKRYIVKLCTKSVVEKLSKN